FHGNFRCPTCHKLETYSKEAIEENFKDEIASGKIVFNVINTDKKENRHFINDYQLYTKSLVISLIENGKEVKSKNLVKIWDYVGNKQKFFDYVAGEINSFLQG
ncbi:MAG: nitrophenyl compound nitroreductase subunit ArsF family protein, partial [Candidatus Omnitrophota bacterium]